MTNMTIVIRTVTWVLVGGMATSSAALAQSSPTPASPDKGAGPPLVSGVLTGIGDGMSEEQIRGFLRAKGYTDLGRFDREGDAFMIDHGKRYGRAVADLRVDAGTGQVANVEPLDKDQVKVLVEHDGYKNVSVREKEGQEFKVQANRDGRVHSLKVDARTAAIQRDCD
jgi:hypothetical protein